MSTPATAATCSSSLAPRPDYEWFSVGLLSSFPDITDASEKYFKLAWPQKRCPGSGKPMPGCKVFHPPKPRSRPGGDQASSAARTGQIVAAAEEISVDDAPGQDAWELKEQVLVFRYKGGMHAVDHACPHRSYSLSWGAPFDIEDSGRVVVGQGLRCRGHGYAFELTTGIGDRGDYRLGVWDVELRPPPNATLGERDVGEEDKEVWVRKRNVLIR